MRQSSLHFVLYLSIFVSVCLTVFQPLSVSVLFFCLPACRNASLPVCLPVCLSHVISSVYLLPCLSIYLPVFVPTSLNHSFYLPIWLSHFISSLCLLSCQPAYPLFLSVCLSVCLLTAYLNHSKPISLCMHRSSSSLYVCLSIPVCLPRCLSWTDLRVHQRDVTRGEREEWEEGGRNANDRRRERWGEG